MLGWDMTPLHPVPSLALDGYFTNAWSVWHKMFHMQVMERSVVSGWALLRLLSKTVVSHPGTSLPNSGLCYYRCCSIRAQSCPQASCQENQLKQQELLCPEMLGDFAPYPNVGAAQSQWLADIRAQSWFLLPQWGTGISMVPFILPTPGIIRLRPDASQHHILSGLLLWPYPVSLSSLRLWAHPY